MLNGHWQSSLINSIKTKSRRAHFRDQMAQWVIMGEQLNFLLKANIRLQFGNTTFIYI